MELGLGTVQFGLDYGISNTTGKVPPESVRAILECAHEEGIRVLDTAAAYGDSELVIGNTLKPEWQFRIVTKLPALKKDAVTQKDIVMLDTAFQQSLHRLKRTRLAGILMHNPGDLLVPGGETAYRLLLSFKESGAAEKIGISVYTAAEIDRIFYHYDFDLVQLPLNVLDQRLLRSGHIRQLKTKGVEVHVRSAFLQGLLLMPIDRIDPYFSPIMPVLQRYADFRKQNNLNPCEGAIVFLRMQKDIDVVLTGVTSIQELIGNLNAFTREFPPSLDFADFAVDAETMVNPRYWKLD